MAELVLGIGASHTTLMNTQWDKVDHLPEAHAFKDGLEAARNSLKSLQPDLAIIIGSNHFRGHWLDLMPSFAIGVDEVISSGEHGTPEGPQKTRPELPLKLPMVCSLRDLTWPFPHALPLITGSATPYNI